MLQIEKMIAICIHVHKGWLGWSPWSQILDTPCPPWAARNLNDPPTKFQFLGEIVKKSAIFNKLLKTKSQEKKFALHSLIFPANITKLSTFNCQSLRSNFLNANLHLNFEPDMFSKLFSPRYFWIKLLWNGVYPNASREKRQRQKRISPLDW